MNTRTRFIITLEGAIKGDGANIHALRNLLKRPLWSSALRCTEVREINARHATDHESDGGER